MSYTREENGSIRTEVEPTHLALIQGSRFNITPGKGIHQPSEHFMRFFVFMNQRNDTLPHYTFDTPKQLAFTVTQAMHHSQDVATIVMALGKSTRGSEYDRRNEQAKVKRTTQSHK
jgi:hypothetical protein